MTKPTMAKKIVIDHPTRTFTIDGEQFPWHLAQEMTVGLSVGDPGIYRVGVQIFTEEVVINE